MNSVEILLRQVGTPHKGLNVISAVELSEYIEYQFISQGYELQATHYLGEVKGEQGGVQGYRMVFVFVKSVSQIQNLWTETLSGSDSANPPTEKPKRGRPPKAE